MDMPIDRHSQRAQVTSVAMAARAHVEICIESLSQCNAWTILTAGMRGRLYRVQGPRQESIDRSADDRQ